jgi:AraC family transcriptional regulator
MVEKPMTNSDSYGEAFGKRLNAQATAFVARALPKTIIAVTEMRCDSSQNVLSTPPIEEDAYLVGVHFKNFPQYEYWEDGKAAPVSVIRPGETIIYDVKRRPIFHLNSGFHTVHFYLPRAALNAIADDANAARIQDLYYKPAVARADPVLRGIAEILLPLFRNPNRISRLFMDHVMLAVGHQVAFKYGGMQLKERPFLGGLSPYQERRAKELLRENLSGETPLATIASECGLSLVQFSKAFRKTTGVPPHRWVIQQRIALAKTLLRESSAALSEVALACGFSDQSHFTRYFSALVGVSPGVWRLSVRG